MTIPLSAIPHGACSAARSYCETKPDLDTAWTECERGDWMLWLAARVGVEHHLIVEAACDCAELALPYASEESLLACIWAIDAARRWARGETDIEEAMAARSAAIAYAYAYASAYAYAYASAHASAYAYAPAAASAYAAASAAAAAAGDARKTMERATADAVRARIPWAAVAAKLGGAA